MLLQQDELLLQQSITVAVLTVLFARRAGWPDDVLAELGVAGLLHDLGQVIDEAGSERAAFVWLLERGDDDVWLRSALVARNLRDDDWDSCEATGPLAAVALVRLAVAAATDGRAGIEAACRAQLVPESLAAVARTVLA